MTRTIGAARATARCVGVAMAIAAASAVICGARAGAQTASAAPPSSPVPAQVPSRGLGADTATIIDLVTAEAQVQAKWARGNMMGNDHLRAAMADLERIHRLAYRYAGTASDEHGTTHILIGLTSPTTPTFTGYIVLLGVRDDGNVGGPITGRAAADGCHMTASIERPSSTITLDGPCSGRELTGAMVIQRKNHRQAAEYSIPRDE